MAVATEIDQATVDFIELDEAHLATIKKNCQQNNISEERFNIMTGDLRYLDQTISDIKYDFILSNPPYIDKALGRTDTSVVNFEPALALYGEKLASI